MKPGYPQIGEKRGLHCPKCGGCLGAKYVAKSYASPAGQFRTRVCSCGAEVETSETVIGVVAEVIDVTDLEKDQVRMLTQLIAGFRKQNVVIDMPYARLPAPLPALTERDDVEV